MEDSRVFKAEKARVLAKVDLSRKGSVDEPIEELVEYINADSSFYTSSSCSGRISVFCESTERHKKQCNWLLVSHDEISHTQLMESLSHTHSTEPPGGTNDDSKETGDDPPPNQQQQQLQGYVFFKFEPFILHTMCRTLHHAQTMLQAAVSSGFRNSGISLGRKGRIMLAVRSTHSLEVPVSYQNRLIVGKEYLQHIVDLGNAKLRENKMRIERFFSELRNALEGSVNGVSKVKPSQQKLKRNNDCSPEHSPLTPDPNELEDTDLELNHLFTLNS